MKNNKGRQEKNERTSQHSGQRSGMSKRSSSSDGSVENLKKLFEEDLQDIYWAEKHLVNALPKLAKASESEELRRAFEDHQAQTQTHVTRLEEVFSTAGLKAHARKCDAMEGLTEEANQVMEDHDKGSVRDCGLIVAAQKVEHYEISAYGSLRSLAQVMGMSDAAEILQETLNEESQADKLLTQIAETTNEQAFHQHEAMTET